jgi:alpha-1,6-mannosyltransferase
LISFSARGLLWIAALAEAVLALLSALALDKDSFPAYLALYFAMSVPWLAASYVAVREIRSQPRDLFQVLLVAAILRGIFLPAGPVLSDDIFRYVWDGRVQHAGTNPYVYPPDDARLSPVKEEIPRIYDGINNKEIPTIYPPLMQILFYAATSVSTSLVWMKTFFTLLDLALVFVLARLLAALKRPPLRALVYAWSPLPVVEIAGSGHNDVAAVLLLVLALLMFEKDRASGSLLFTVGSGLAKIGGFALLPFFARFFKPRAFWAAALLVVLVWLPYASAGGLAFRGLREYALRWRGNDSLFHLLFVLTGSPGNAKVASAAILAALVLLLLRKKTPPVRAAFWIFGAILLLAPTMHPWYLLWMAPRGLPPSGLALPRSERGSELSRPVSRESGRALDGGSFRQAPGVRTVLRSPWATLGPPWIPKGFDRSSKPLSAERPRSTPLSRSSGRSRSRISASPRSTTIVLSGEAFPK